MMTPLPGNALTRALRRALRHLYDPVELRHNPLPVLLGLRAFNDPVADLRTFLIAAVAALKPALNAPTYSNAQRYHDLLTFRFVEQMSQKEVASDMALSLRHLQRLEGQALRALAEALAAAHGVTLVWNGDDDADEPEPPDQLQGEIDWLKTNYPLEKVAVRELLRPALETLAPLFQAQSMVVQVVLPEDLPPARAHVIPVQQAILHLAGLIAESFPGGALTVRGAAGPSSVMLTLAADSPRQQSSAALAELSDGITLSRQVIEACGGALDAGWGHGKFNGVLNLDAREHNPVVLVVDDNQDTLLLLERYLANSPYTFVGTNQPAQVLTLLDQRRPSLVILDVMLPETDGWSLLAQIKQHPRGRDLPIVISTILPQEKLAHALGADAFLRKPFTAQQLLDLIKQLAD